MTARSYKTPAAFKTALEQRLRASSLTGVAFGRRRQLLIFDRFLARLGQIFGDNVMLKGGLVLELRLDQARTTKDVDLRLIGSPDDVLARLQDAGRLDLADFMTFEVTRDADHPDIRNDGMKYDGLRFMAECKLAGQRYGDPFGVDVAFGDPFLGEPERVTAADVLAFAGIPPPNFKIYPVETHIAEKLHAYTMPRDRPNSRVKDLPDLALLATTRELDAGQIRAALEQTFDFRHTHVLPSALPEPPTAWTEPYARISNENELRWRSLADVFEAASAFLNPVLAGGLSSTWLVGAWAWSIDAERR